MALRDMLATEVRNPLRLGNPKTADWLYDNPDYFSNQAARTAQNQAYATGQAPIPSDWTPRGNVMPYQDWLTAQGPGYRPTGDNDPYYEWANSQYQLPSYGGTDPMSASLGDRRRVLIS